MKAFALISGGLDSILAARVVKEQGVEVLPLNFKIPFCQRKKNGSVGKSANTLAEEYLNQGLIAVDTTDDFLRLLLRPKYGFGSHMNPCIDCKILMLKKAKELMASYGAAFVVTGEVLGQRPMSQHRQALEAIERESGLEGLLLRPLSARLLPETLPEKEGWVGRNDLFDFNGRSRRPQIKLAKRFNISDYPNPAGGCLLTDAQFSNRLKDLIAHKELNPENVTLLKVGRHFRLTPHAKLTVGRNEAENKELEALGRKGDYIFMPGPQTAGPTCLGRGEFSDELVRLSSQIACCYSDLNGNVSAKIICSKDGYSTSFEVNPIAKERLKGLRL